jgi:flagellar biogenesis protein FliO
MDFIQPLAAIVLVMGLLGGALFLLKRRGAVAFHLPGVSQRGSSAQRRLEVMERVSLGPHHALHLVRAGDRCILVGTAPSSCQILDSAFSVGDQK